MRKNKKSPEHSYAEFAELVTRVMRDTSPRGVAETAYLFGENIDNERASFGAARKLWRTGRARTISIDDFGRAYGYEGFAHWRKKLIAAGIPRSAIHGMLIAPDFPPSTHAEAWGLIRHAKKKKWRVIYVVAPPVHMLRAFMTVVSAAVKEKSKLKIYSFPADPERWETRATYSQETWKARRSDELRTELRKIEKYYRKGDMVSVREVLAYLNKRDRK